jgi:hypothetical protein
VSKLDYVRALLDFPLFVALLLGALAALVFEWRVGALVAVISLVASLMLHVVNGVIEYRRVMKRPWPRVAPLDDDDDD